MVILTIRTDKPEAEIGLYNDHKKLDYKIWTAHRQLAETLHQEIEHLLALQGWTLLQGPTLQKTGVEGLVCYQGPGSFTGLRIGLTVGNALAYSLKVPIVGEMSEDWINKGIARLKKSENDSRVVPEYGHEANITKPRK